ncbi:hypothetical protein H5410_051802 [Solanum commersonii]|uniref:Uncharacterized protein n=1 Tax=Solanum commersonii TaxID=4109 RepID=A0A9J5X0H7_SOLCO|nr:hypothetical protein H5410_051802 [Solanum commersonii]
MIEINQECAGIARIVEAKNQQAQISEEYEIRFGKTQEIGSPSSNPRLSFEYGRNSLRKSISYRYPVLQGESITEQNGKNKKFCYKLVQQPITSKLCMIANFRLESVDEVFALVPPLKKVLHVSLKVMPKSDKQASRVKYDRSKNELNKNG